MRGLSRIDGAVEALAQQAADEVVLEALEDAADEIVSNDLCHRFVPFASRLANLDYAGRPWAALPAGVATCACDRERGRSVLRAALEQFETTGDAYGEGLACFLEGVEDLGEGQLRSAAAWWDRSRALLGPSHVLHRLILAHRSLEAYEDGDMTAASALAEQAMWAAELAGDTRAEAVAAVYLGFFNLYTGRFDVCRSAIARAANAFALVPIENRYEEPLLWFEQGALRALVDEYDAAMDAFEGGLSLARAAANEWYEAVGLVARAEFTAPMRPTDAARDAKQALLYLAPIDERWWSRWARSALAIAHLHSGNDEAGLQACEHVLTSRPNAVERGRILIVKAELLESAGRSSGSLLEEAEQLLDAGGASFWAARASVVRAAIDPNRTEYHRRAAARRAPPKRSPEWERLLEGRGDIRLDLRGNGRLAVSGGTVQLPTQAAMETLVMVAIAGDAGLRTDVIAERLWPDEDVDRVRHRLDNLLSGLRHDLLPTLRLSRQAGVVRLRLRPGECGVVDALQAVDRALDADMVDDENVRQCSIRLREPVLDQIEAPWIGLENMRLVRLADRVDRALAHK